MSRLVFRLTLLILAARPAVSAGLVDDMTEIAQLMYRNAKYMKEETDRLAAQGAPGYSRLKIRTNLVFTDVKALTRTLEDSSDVPEDMGKRLSRIRGYLDDYRKSASTLQLDSEFRQAEDRVAGGLEDLTEMTGARPSGRRQPVAYTPRAPTRPGTGAGNGRGGSRRQELHAESDFRAMVDDLNFLASRLLEQLRADTRNRGQERELAIQDTQAFVQATEILESEWGIHRTRPDRYQKLVRGLMQFRELLADRFANLTLSETTKRTWKQASRIIEELDERVTSVTR